MRRFFFIFPLIIFIFLNSQNLINLNEATFKDLLSLGISRVLAKRIIKYRKKVGEFKSVEDLLKVKGMTKEIFNKIKNRVFVPQRDEEEIYEELLEEAEQEVIGGEEIDAEILEDLRANPLDLNSATIRDLMQIPGVTHEIARNIIRWRAKHEGFEDVRELKKVPGITNKIYERMLPFVKVSKVIEREKFNGEIRLRFMTKTPFSFDSDGFKDDENFINYRKEFQNPIYFYNRTRFFYGRDVEIGWIIKRDDWGKDLNLSNLRDNQLMKNYLVLRNVGFINKLIIGDYGLSFGQGLILGEKPFLYRPYPYKPRGIRENRSSSYNEGFHGIAFSGILRGIDFALFYSDKSLIAALNSDGTVRDTVYEILYENDDTLDFNNEDNFENIRNLRIKTYGGRFEKNIYGIKFGLTSYFQEFTPLIHPHSKDIPQTRNVFRGDKINVYGIDFNFPVGKRMSVYFDYGVSKFHTFEDENRTKWKWDSGDALSLGIGYRHFAGKSWIEIYNYSPRYYNFYSSGHFYLGDDKGDFNEKGIMILNEFRIRRHKFKVQFDYAKQIEFSDDINSSYEELPWGRRLWLEGDFVLSRKFNLFIRNQIEEELKRVEVYGTSPKEYVYSSRVKNKIRIQLTYAPTSKVRLRWRWEDVFIRYPVVNDQWRGYITYGEVKYKPSKLLSIDSRIIFFNTPEDVYVSELEYYWPRSLMIVSYDNMWDGRKGMRFYIMPRIKFSRNSTLWIKIETNLYDFPEDYYNVSYSDYDAESKYQNDATHKFKVQYDFKF